MAAVDLPTAKLCSPFQSVLEVAALDSCESAAYCAEGVSGAQDAVVWNLAYTVTGKRAIFGVFNLWCTLNHVNVKINRICKPTLRTFSESAACGESACHALMVGCLAQPFHAYPSLWYSAPLPAGVHACFQPSQSLSFMIMRVYLRSRCACMQCRQGTW